MVLDGKTTLRREPLTRERIIDASLRIVEAEGLEALSMRRLGKELRVKDMALYHHFERKDEILTGLVQRMFAEFEEVKSHGMPWKDYMRLVMHSFRAVGIAYPQTFLLFARRPWHSTGRTGDIAALVEAGFDPKYADYVLRNLADYVTGFVVRHDVGRLMVENSAPPDETYNVDAAFEFGLSAILDGCDDWLRKSQLTSNRQI